MDLDTRPTGQRHWLVFLLFLHTVNTYMDRVCISTAKTAMQGELGLSDRDIGYVFGIFAIGYALFQVPSGWLCDAFGPRRALSFVVILWSLFTAITGAVHRVGTLLVVRFLFGVGEAGAYPGATRALYRWLPVRERGLGQGIFHSGARIGAALSLFAMPWLIDWIGWRWTFVANGLVGFLWAGVWWVWFRDDPREHPWTNEAERREIEAGLAVEADTRRAHQSTPFILLVTTPNILLAMLQYAASNITFFFSISWLHPFMQDTWGAAAAKWSSIPLLFGAVSLWLSGAAVTGLYQRGYRVWSRRLPAMLGFSLSAVGLFLCTQVSGRDSFWPFVACFSLAIFGVEMILSPSWSFCMDIGGERSGAVSGAMNMVGNLGAALSAIVFPYFRDHVTLPVFAEQTGSPNSFLVFAGVMNVVACLCWTMMDPWRTLRTNVTPAELRLRWVGFFALVGGVLFAVVYAQLLMSK
jgi:ACS family glucarate transporter-like MFS transporter